MAKALVVAAPHSGSGKTLVTLGLLRALRNAGYRVAAAKVGPDYIDPQFHARASGGACINLDLWAMGEPLCRMLARQHAQGADLLIAEGVMGLFDGPQGAEGSTADLARALEAPILLVIDCAHQAQSIAALVRGFANHRPDIKLAGLFLNRIKSDRHASILHEALASCGIPIIGQMRQTDSLSLPSRHLGLVQAIENHMLEKTLETAASGVARETILDKLFEIAAFISNQPDAPASLPPPLAQTIAIATDEAFSFAYAHLMNGWRAQGAEIRPFSPLANQAPSPHAGAVFLPGGYPELHAGHLSANAGFMNGLRSFKGTIYGECGGYMVLGAGLIDADGHRHAMAGLLPLETSFASRKLHLGYRQLTSLRAPWPMPLRGHEFHYSTVAKEGPADRLFAARNAAGGALPDMGLRVGNVMGSYAHVISGAP